MSGMGHLHDTAPTGLVWLESGTLNIGSKFNLPEANVVARHLTNGGGRRPDWAVVSRPVFRRKIVVDLRRQLEDRGVCRAAQTWRDDM